VGKPDQVSPTPAPSPLDTMTMLVVGRVPHADRRVSPTLEPRPWTELVNVEARDALDDPVRWPPTFAHLMPAEVAVLVL
jgi:hypothetical protein